MLKFYYLKRYILLLALPLALTSCSYIEQLFPHRHARHAASARPEYQVAGFIQHLSMAQLLLSGKHPDMSAVSADLEALQAYTAPKQARLHKGHNVQNVIILDCKSKNGGMLRLAAPYSDKNQDSLLELLNRMDETKCLPDNIWPATVIVNRGKPMLFDGISPGQAAYEVHGRLGAITGSAHRPAPLAEAETQIELLRLFIDNHQRDAAYLADEDAKHMLAAAENIPDNKETVKTLLKELEQMEEELHQTMPFTL